MIVATNIAETSLTINGVVHVIGCGFIKAKTIDPQTGLSALQATQISRAGARQRAGRAGRVCAGYCHRLYTLAAYEDFHAQPVPAILRGELTGALLNLLDIGVNGFVHFPWFEAPPLHGGLRAG